MTPFIQFLLTLAAERPCGDLGKRLGLNGNKGRREQNRIVCDSIFP